MNKFIKLNVINNEEIIDYFININHVVYIYIKEEYIHLKLNNDIELKLNDTNIDIFMDKISILTQQ